MGNRATISLKNDTQERGIYVHWNGGEGSVRGFIEETKKRLGGKASIGSDEGSIVTFYSTLQGVCREFFGYGGQYKDRSPLSIYHCAHDVKGSTEDNGAYIIEDDFSCERLDSAFLDTHEERTYNYMKGFFEEVHHAMSAINDTEIESYSKIPTSSEEYQEFLDHAEEVARCTALRVERLKELKAQAELREAEEAAQAMEAEA